MPVDGPAHPIRIAPPPPGWSGGTATAARQTSRRRRRVRSEDRPTAAMVLGIVSLFANVLLLPSLIGILYGSRSLRAGTAHRGQAIAGIVCGSVGAAFVLVQLALVLPGALHGSHVTGAHVAESITSSSARTGSALSDVTCPDAPSDAAGSTITCTGQAPSIGAVSIVVTFDGPSRGFDWRVAQGV